MKSRLAIIIALLMLMPLVSCRPKEKPSEMKIIFLHHSTGGVIWNGKSTSIVTKAARRISPRLASMVSNPQMPGLFEDYNNETGKNYLIEERFFPKESPYGWNNYPYDYYNIWVKHAGEEPFMEEPTLEILTKEYQVIIFKHCFPISNIQAERDSADINSDIKTLPNYKLQYLALRDKLHEFPDTKFILFTGAAQVKSNVDEDKAERAREFFSWVTGEWDQPDDNIYLWDLYSLQTEGGIYFKEDYAVSAEDSHPNGDFAGKAVKLLFDRIIDVVENNGTGTEVTGKNLQ